MVAAIASAQSMVYLEQSETLNFDEQRLPDAQILKGNVRFRHEDALMFCDSAYFYEKTNSLDAFGHVRMIQGDTLFGYGDVLYYNGNTKLARLRKHVRLVHKATTLRTDSLNYDRARDIAYYFRGGTIEDSLNVLKSVWGQYIPSTKQATFRHEVQLTNPNFILTSDTLLYNTETKIANLVSPTSIVYEEETTILSSNGWYNTETEHSLLLDRSHVIHQDGKTMTGDSIFYDKHIGFGRIIGNMEVVDSAQHVTLYGNYGEVYEENEQELSHGFATDSALMVDWSDEDSYMYVHADSLFTEQIPFVCAIDSATEVDSAYNRVRAYHGVRVYKEDVQAVCDSMVYRELDSLMVLYTLPVCWSDSNQMSADSIHIQMKNDEVDFIHGMGSAICIQQKTEEYFNQMSGKEMFAYVREGELRQVDVNGNAETVFYPEDEGTGDFIGMNVTESSYVKIFLENQQIHHVLFTTQTTGTLYPLDQIPAGKDRLTGFFWAEQERPLKPGDVFLKPERTPWPGSTVKSAVSVEPTSEEGEGGEEGEKQPKKGNNRMSNRKLTR